MITVSKTTSRPNVRFSPRGFKRAKKEFERGDPRKLIAMMQEAEVDSHVSGCLSARTAGFKDEWSLTSFEDQSEHNERREWFAGVLQRLGIRELLEAIHQARLYLYSVVDFEWDMVDGRQVPIQFKAFDQQHFVYEDDQLKIDFPRERHEIPDEVLVVEKQKTPIMLPVLRDYILKEFGLEAWSAFIENFGEAFIFAKYPAGVDEDFKKEVRQGLENLAASSRGTAPDGTDIEIHESGRSTGDHEQYTERADKGISIQLLGHANAVMDSDGMQVGQNQTAYKVRHDIAVDDMYFIEPWVQRLITVIGDRNFGDGRYPRFELNKSEPIDVTQHAEIIDMAWRHGVPIQADEYRKMGLHVDEGEGPFRKPDQPALFD